ncbi:Riboflavin synthase [Buchnera aphidicola (Eriosoma lanigerum)]|uniref:riboflavin synthase subunit alpha n=1 Tax=Buchnera aphidicola TaxID=9 RepID=UPI003463A00D
MFTGIIDGIAKIISIKNKNNYLTYTIQVPKHLLVNLVIGASISNNGCCLSVTSIFKDLISFDIISETLRCTNLGMLKLGDYINIERSKKFSDEIGGHILSGHISTVSKCIKIIKFSGNSQLMYYQLCDNFFMKYIFYKGFISINGISLTITEVSEDYFSVHLIPDTMLKTNMKNVTNGDVVNIEIDYFTQVIVDTTEKFINLCKLN